MTDTGGPAYPVPSYVNADGETFSSNIEGMTLLDYFAGQAMETARQEIVAENEHFAEDPAHKDNRAGDGNIAVRAFRIAETMIAEKRRREK